MPEWDDRDDAVFGIAGDSIVMSATRIYLDHAATTPLDPRVLEAMLPWMDGEFGNPSSQHEDGRRARQAIDEAREIVSQHLGCLFGEVIFTSSGTEAANLAILGSALEALKNGSARRRILMSAVEHHCVLHTQPTLDALGFSVEFLPVNHLGLVEKSTLEKALGDDVLLTSIMHANNETGVIANPAEYAQIVKQAGSLFHVDAVQTLGTLPTQVEDLGVDLLHVSAHKIYGPKAVGALYIRAGVLLSPWVIGGGQERDMRAGTENVAGLVGFGAALSHFEKPNSEARDAFFQEMGDQILRTIPAEVPTLPCHAHFRIPGKSAENMLIRLDRAGISASSASACSSGSQEPSHVLIAMGMSPEAAGECIRFSFGKGQDAETGREAARRVKALLASSP